MAWVIWEAVIRAGLSADNPLFQVAILPGAFSPAVAAVVVRKWVTREGFADAGLRLNRRRWRYYVVGWFLPFLAASVVVLLAIGLGISDPDFTLERALTELAPEGTAPSSLPSGIVAILPVQLAVTALFATPLLWGEEFGWRGYLQVRLLAHRPLLAAIATGCIWALWHLPINLRGYNFPDQPLVGMLVFTVSAIMLSIIFGWLRVKTGSIWSASLGAFRHERHRRGSDAVPLPRWPKLDMGELRGRSRVAPARSTLRLYRPDGPTQEQQPWRRNGSELGRVVRGWALARL